MNLIEFTIFIVILFWLAWTYKIKIRPFIEKKKLQKWLEKSKFKKTIKNTIKTVDNLYKNTDPLKLSKLIRAQNNIQGDKFVYGEIDSLALFALLDIAEPKTGEIFYDLGSGAGKSVFLAGLTFNFAKACGIELLAPLYHLANERLKVLQKVNKEQQEQTPDNISFIQGDLLEYNFSDANIIFINATGFRGELWDKIVSKLKKLKKGTRIILTSHKLDNKDFKLLYSGMELMSWGMNSAFVYRRA